MAAVQKGAIFPAEGGAEKGILDFTKWALSQGVFDAVLIPARVPAGDSFSYLLIQDESLLRDASPLPPIMPVQGARAISSVTKRGKGKKKIAAIIRPCEAMATIELTKLKQADLENIILITVDCPGVLPLADYFKSPEKGDEVFKDACEKWNNESARPVCRICDRFSATGGEDLHIGTLGVKSGSILLIPGSAKGENVLDRLGILLEEDVSGWEDSVNKLAKERKKERDQANDALRIDIEGINRLVETFSTCINCHNCMRVCPICYCRQCNFDSDKMKYSFEDYITRAEARGVLIVPTDTMLFHIGRMLHMSLSCVSCGMCEDVCPMDIPVA
ncbi:MAG: 4Fe-4S dicluster domain-containing protein, partial [Chloroflexota bacterium]|nr:4Fe-4S dicluster domain-containing protein [Chloroflexota bacterium]